MSNRQARVKPAIASLRQRVSDMVLGPVPPEVLPQNVMLQIGASDRFSEILVGIVQAAIIAVFGVLYSASTKAFPPDTMIQPVPWALAIYALFTGLRLWLAFRDRLTPLVLSLSVIIDFTVLMTAIWSFHLQYQQPPALYLKAPSLMYVFILIALRALRYDARYVILAGITGIAGWLVLVLYAVEAPGGAPITRNFVEYMTSNSILIGAEVDKLVSIMLVTAILSLMVIRSRRLLVAQSSERYAADELSRFFAPEVAGQLRQSSMTSTPGDGRMVEAAIMMIDLRGFTKLAARLAPHETIGLLNDYHSRVIPAVTANGGSIDKYLGDGIMVTFGAITPDPSYAANALRAAEDVLAASIKWSQALASRGSPAMGIGVGMASGQVLAGIVGDKTRLEYTVIGDAANLAAKLEKHTKKESSPIVLTDALLKAAEGNGYRATRALRKLGRRKIEGSSRPELVWGMN